MKELEKIKQLQDGHFDKFAIEGKTIDKCHICKHHLSDYCFDCTEARGAIICIDVNGDYVIDRLSNVKITSKGISGINLQCYKQVYWAPIVDIKKAIIFYGDKYKVFNKKTGFDGLLSQINGKETLIYYKIKK